MEWNGCYNCQHNGMICRRSDCAFVCEKCGTALIRNGKFLLPPESDEVEGVEVESDENTEVESDDYEPCGPDDFSDDGDALAAAGMGTNEDYGDFGGN